MTQLALRCFEFREMLRAFIGRELRQRYVGSILGRAWPFLQPLLMLSIYYVVFVEFLGLRLIADTDALAERLGSERAAAAYQPLLMASGLVPWMVSAEFIMRVTNVIMENGGLVKKIAFPSELLPVYLIGTAVVNMLIMLSVFIVMTFLLTGLWPPMPFMLLPVLVIHMVFLLGLGYVLSTINVFVRDLGQLVPIAVNLWFFMTPIFYLKYMAPPDKRWIYDYNPMAYLIDLYRWVLIMPDHEVAIEGGTKFVPVEFMDTVPSFAIFAAIAVILFMVGYRFFMRNKAKFADEI